MSKPSVQEIDQAFQDHWVVKEDLLKALKREWVRRLEDQISIETWRVEEKKILSGQGFEEWDHEKNETRPSVDPKSMGGQGVKSGSAEGQSMDSGNKEENKEENKEKIPSWIHEQALVKCFLSDQSQPPLWPDMEEAWAWWVAWETMPFTGCNMDTWERGLAGYGVKWGEAVKAHTRQALPAVFHHETSLLTVFRKWAEASNAPRLVKDIESVQRREEERFEAEKERFKKIVSESKNISDRWEMIVSQKCWEINRSDFLRSPAPIPKENGFAYWSAEGWMHEIQQKRVAFKEVPPSPDQEKCNSPFPRLASLGPDWRLLKMSVLPMDQWEAYGPELTRVHLGLIRKKRGIRPADIHANHLRDWPNQGWFQHRFFTCEKLSWVEETQKNKASEGLSWAFSPVQQKDLDLSQENWTWSEEGKKRIRQDLEGLLKKFGPVVLNDIEEWLSDTEPFIQEASKVLKPLVREWVLEHQLVSASPSPTPVGKEARQASARKRL